MPGKYRPLAQCLAAQPGDRVILTFAAVEAILGTPLPATAYGYRQWWREPGRSHTEAWLDAGWRVQAVSLSRHIVTFIRTEAR